nr:aminodeoxychorismate synthase component I [Aliidiomarina iranensis]
MFAPFAHEPWAMLLDSAGAEHPNSRYDILLRQPEKTCTEISTIDGEPFAEINQWLNAATVTELPEEYADLPFQGGLAGLFGYDLGRTLEHIPEIATADIALPDIAVGLYFHALIIDHQRQRVVAIHPKNATITPEAFWAANNSAGAKYPNQGKFTLRTPWQSNMDAAEYTQRINAIHEFLRAGDCYQINLAQRFHAEFSGDPWGAYLALRETNQAPFSAWLNIPGGVVLSLSPERFLQTYPDGSVETRPIKGTRPRGKDAADDASSAEILKNSAKDRAENLMIVDLLRNDLSRVCTPGSVSVPELFKIESFHAVHHLVSTVQGKLAPAQTPLSLLAAAFPGGSITGAPKIRAMEIIESLEPHRRSVYCGSIGYFSVHGHSDTSITIRTLCCVDDHIYCWAGGGIVIDSKAEAEYQETLDKVAKILPVLSSLNVNTPEFGALDTAVAGANAKDTSAEKPNSVTINAVKQNTRQAS